MTYQQYKAQVQEPFVVVKVVGCDQRFRTFVDAVIEKKKR